MGRTCPVCCKMVQNISSHLGRVHKINGPNRTKLLMGSKDGQRFTPYPVTRPMNENTLCNRFQLLHPFTALVAGMTGSGKTSWVQTLLEHANQVIQPPPQRILWSYSQWQPAYDSLMSHIPDIEFVKGIPHDLDEDWFFDPEVNNLMVIDDQMAETSNDKRILNLFTKGSHHRNLSVIFLVQNVYFQGKIMRTLSLNASYLVLFKNPRDKLQMLTLGKQMYPGKTNHFVEKYEAAVKRPYGYLFVDLKPNTRDECRLRTNVLPNDAHLSQTGGQSDGMNAMNDYFKRQSYLQPPILKVMQELEAQMAATINDPSLPPDIKLKEYDMLFNRYLAFQKQLLIHPVEINTPHLGSSITTVEVNQTPQQQISPATIDSGIGTVTPKEPSLIQRITSKISTPFKSQSSNISKSLTPLKVPQSTPLPSDDPIESPSTSGVVFPSTPLTTKGKEPQQPPRWIPYEDADKYPGVSGPPRRSERIRLMMKSIPGWEKY